MSIDLITYDNLNKSSHEILHFSSTRLGGVSDGEFNSLNLGNYTDDSPEKIAQNIDILAQALHINCSQIFNAHQTHGTHVKQITPELIALSTKERKKELEGYDAFISNIPQTCITITTADCVPILLFDKENNAIAAIHSGWRSTANNITQVTIDKMQKTYGTNPSKLIAAIGPCISKNVYEVGEDVYDAFTKKETNTDKFFSKKECNKYLFDIRSVVSTQLKAGGIANIEISPYCTYLNKELFFSARRQGNASGRMLSGIMLL